jgi:uncharacterized membrane protein
MEKMLVVVLDNEKKAYEASRALSQLDAEGTVSIYAMAVVGKGADGKVSVKEAEGEFPVGLAGGTAIGALIGLLGGPVGFAMGAAAGSLAGGFSDLYVADVDAEFVDDVTAKLAAGKFAVVADLSEEWVTPVDIQMEKFGGTVLRTQKENVEAEQRARRVAQLHAGIDQLKAEQAKANAEQKAKLQARIDKLNAELKAQEDRIRQRSEQLKNETEAKVNALHQRAAAAHAEAKAGFNAELKCIREAFENTDAKLRHSVAEHLRKAAARVEKEPPAARAHAHK